MRKLIVALGALALGVCGCVDTCGLEEDEQKKAVERYWPEGPGMLIYDQDSTATVTGKVIGRVIGGVFTLGLSEVGAANRQTDANRRYAEDQVVRQTYSSLVGKEKKDVVRVLGAPDSTTSDGDGGEILVYKVSKNVKLGLTETPVSYSNQFFVDKNGKCYLWREED